MPISVIVGAVPMAGRIVRSKSALQDIGQLAGHLVPEGIDPDVGGPPLGQVRPDLRLEDLDLLEQAGDRMLGLGVLRDEVPG